MTHSERIDYLLLVDTLIEIVELTDDKEIYRLAVNALKDVGFDATPRGQK